jgi:Uma2 family endonuclease
MEANRGPSRWTYPEFARLPSEGGRRYEVIDGELVVTPAPALRHQRIATDLVTLLNAFVRSHDLGEVFAGPVDVLFAEGDYLEPDIVFVGKTRSHILTDRGIEGPPDLVVEIASPSTADRDRGIKLERYRLFGVAEYWVVDPDARTVEVWELAEGAREPRVLGAEATLRWRPARSAPVLEVGVGDVVP